MDTIAPPSRKSTPSRGKATRDAILREGVALARAIGVSGLSIGGLAEAVGMSKSGLFAHFGSKEELQIAVLQAAQDDFTELVLKPAFAEPRGLTRLRALLDRWIGWSTGNGQEGAGGCVMLSACHEFDDRPGVVRDHLVLVETNMMAMLHRSIRQLVETQALPPDTDVTQFAYELFGMVMSAHFHTRLLRDPHAAMRARMAFERLVANPPHLQTTPPVAG